MKYLSVLGSTGSIGSTTLSIVERFPERFGIKVLAAKSNVNVLAQQIMRFSPQLAVVVDDKTASELKRLLPGPSATEIMYGPEGYQAAATHPDVEMVVVAIVGAAGLLPTLSAIEAKKTIALANKETLVMAGELVMAAAAANGVSVLPIDSEHSAIFQCIKGHRVEDLDKIILTASGGPFLDTPGSAFDKIKPADALKHPNWEMGKKITIDSATLMNKGLEVLEAKSLFQVAQDRINVVIHPQSIIHSMVAYRDGAVMAQLGIPDMMGAVAYALSYPGRLPLGQPIPDFAGIGTLTFKEPDRRKFPCLELAFQSCRIGGTLPAVLNGANEAAVQAFLENLISFVRIPEIIREVMNRHSVTANPALPEILEADRWAREKAEELVRG
ncbi:1-deoxy-D-xylulose-5-phosphate reductoisomerase [Thermodesulfobacteriota bacterium]